MVAMIAAVDINNGIGYNNNLLFNCKEDMQHFRNVTLGKTIVMGRKTAESLPRGFLPHRNNLILSSGSKQQYDIDGYFVKTTNESIEDITHNYKDIVVIGGGSIYEQFMPYTDKIYLTRFEYEADNCDTFFPDISDRFTESVIRKEILDVGVGNMVVSVVTTFTMATAEILVGCDYLMGCDSK